MLWTFSSRSYSHIQTHGRVSRKRNVRRTFTFSTLIKVIVLCQILIEMVGLRRTWQTCGTRCKCLKINMMFFGLHCECWLNTLKFHILNHLVNALELLWTFLVLNASPYENFNSILKQAHESTSKHLQKNGGYLRFIWLQCEETVGESL